MQTETLYELRFRDTSGQEVGGRIGYGPGGDASVLRFLGYTKRLHYPGLLWFGLDGEHPVLGLLEDLYQIEVWRSVTGGVTWYCDFVGIYRTDTEYEDRGRLNFQGNAIGPLGIIDTVIAWSAGYTDRSEFSASAAETVLKTLVTYNATAAATAAAGRDLTFASDPFTITVEADGSGGNAITKSCSRKQLLETLRDVARIGGGDFDLVRDISNPLAWEFRWFAGQRGTDRSASVIFSRENGNLTDFRYSHRSAQATVAIVGGPGEREERQITVVTSSDYAVSNHREIFINATDQDTVAGRTAKGNEALDAARAIEVAAFNSRQVDGARYGADYCVEGLLGDLVTVVRSHDGVGVRHKITGATVAIDARGEAITLETETP